MKDKRKGTGWSLPPSSAHWGRASPVPHEHSPGEDRNDFWAGTEVLLQRKGRQKPPGLSQPTHTLGLDTGGNPPCPGAHKWHHQVGKEEILANRGGKGSSHFSPCHTPGGDSCPPPTGAGREDNDWATAPPHPAPSPSPLREGDQHEPDQPPSTRKGVRAANDSGTSTSKLG